MPIYKIAENAKRLAFDTVKQLGSLPKESAYRESRPYRQALLGLLSQNGIDATGCNSVADAIIDLIDPMEKGMPGAAAMKPDTVLVNVSMFRERACENEQYETYFSIRMNQKGVEEAEASGSLPSFVLDELRKRLHSELASEAGWNIVARESCLDFNWGDFSMLSDEMRDSLGVFMPSSNASHYCMVKVNQDELLAPISVPVVLKHQFKSKTGEAREHSHPATLNMTDGTICCVGFDEDTSSDDRVFIVFENGDTVDCDPEEDFMRLIGAN